MLKEFLLARFEGARAFGALVEGAAGSSRCAGSDFALVEAMAGFGGVISPPLVVKPSIENARPGVGGR